MARNKRIAICGAVLSWGLAIAVNARAEPIRDVAGVRIPLARIVKVLASDLDAGDIAAGQGRYGMNVTLFWLLNPPEGWRPVPGDAPLSYCMVVMGEFHLAYTVDSGEMALMLGETEVARGKVLKTPPFDGRTWRNVTRNLAAKACYKPERLPTSFGLLRLEDTWVVSQSLSTDPDNEPSIASLGRAFVVEDNLYRALCVTLVPGRSTLLVSPPAKENAAK